MNEEHSEYYKKMMGILDEQIEDVEKPPKFLTEEQVQNIKIEKKISKTKLLEQLKEKYPYSDVPFNRFRDRDPRQYSKLVSTKDLKVAEFVLKWEHEHKKRIHKNMAWELLTAMKENKIISEEFLEVIDKKFQD